MNLSLGKEVEMMTTILSKIHQTIFGADNDRIVNLRAVQWAKLFYVNQYNQEVNKPPKFPTYRLKPMSRTDYLIAVKGSPRETEYERAARLGMLDEWLPVVYLKMSASNIIKFTGDKALSIYKAYCAKQFSSNPKKK